METPEQKRWFEWLLRKLVAAHDPRTMGVTPARKRLKGNRQKRVDLREHRRTRRLMAKRSRRRNRVNWC